MLNAAWEGADENRRFHEWNPMNGQEAVTGVEARVGFLLLPGYSLLSLGAAIDPLRVANRLAGRPLFDWVLLSQDGGPVTATNGVRIEANKAISDDDRTLSLVMVIAGIDVGHVVSRPLLGWLRRLARFGVPIGSVSTGAEILARAGLLNGYRCTIHWENDLAFREHYPHAELTGGLFEIDRNRLTAAGGTAGIDLMLHWIAAQHGEALSAAVSEQFIHDRIRQPDEGQRKTEDQMIRRRSGKLADAIAIMEGNLEDPLKPAHIARQVGLSLRQLERLFRKHRGQTPHRFYLELRLRRARQLVEQTGHSIHEVSVATGFLSQSHFTRCYRELFGQTPSADRRRQDTRVASL